MLDSSDPSGLLSRLQRLGSSQNISVSPHGYTKYIFNLEARPKQRTRYIPGQRPYTPDITSVFEKTVKSLTSQQHPSTAPYSGRLACRIKYLVPTVRGDIDNLGKAILDGMQHVAFKNDGLIDELNQLRAKVVRGAAPRIEVVLRPHIAEPQYLCPHCSGIIDPDELWDNAVDVPF